LLCSKVLHSTYSLVAKVAERIT